MDEPRKLGGWAVPEPDFDPTTAPPPEASPAERVPPLEEGKGAAPAAPPKEESEEKAEEKKPEKRPVGRPRKAQ